MQQINLPYNFFPRDYQVPAFNAFMAPDFQRGDIVHPRRNGKDLLSWNALIAKASQKTALYYYIAPYYNQIRQIIWEGFDDSGRRFLDYIPTDIIKNITKNDMRIDLINGSQIKMQGSDEINRIVGTNPYGIVFTEFSLHKPLAWEYLRPILANNGGWAIFNGTPRGMNHFWDIHNMAQANPNWFSELLTRDDTGIPSLEAIQADRDAGMPEELIQQEYYCSWLSGSVGAYFANDIEKARGEGRLTSVPWDPKLPVHTAWDPGNTAAIWFFQTPVNAPTRWIDYYSHKGGGFPHLVKVLTSKPYSYGSHIGPWDLDVESYDTGVTRAATAAEHGIDFTIMPKLSIQDGVDAARMVFANSVWDQNKCSEGIMSLTHHRAMTSGTNKTLSISSTPDPKTKWASHGCDAARYGAIAILDGYVDNEVHSRVKSYRSIGAQSGTDALRQAMDLMVAQGIIDPRDLGRGVTRNTPSYRSIH